MVPVSMADMQESQLKSLQVMSNVKVSAVQD